MKYLKFRSIIRAACRTACKTLFAASADMDGVPVLRLDTEQYEREQERVLIVKSTDQPNVFELWFEDAAGYDGKIGVLHVER